MGLEWVYCFRVDGDSHSRGESLVSQGRGGPRRKLPEIWLFSQSESSTDFSWFGCTIPNEDVGAKVPQCGVPQGSTDIPEGGMSILRYGLFENQKAAITPKLFGAFESASSLRRLPIVAGDVSHEALCQVCA